MRRRLRQQKPRLELEQAEADAAREEWISLNPNKKVPTLVGREPQIAEAKAEVKSAEARLDAGAAGFATHARADAVQRSCSRGHD